MGLDKIVGREWKWYEKTMIKLVGTFIRVAFIAYLLTYYPSNDLSSSDYFTQLFVFAVLYGLGSEGLKFGYNKLVGITEDD